ncbi:MAG: 4-hydroxythreonine-4-phosphate dehydrogenase, partial [Alphaproteobacteria bacterium HGW-Alphaproteobacteria-12]
MTREIAPPLPLVLSMGEPAGIGPEITLKAWAARARASLPVFFVVGDPDLYRALARALGLAVPIAEIADAQEATACFGDALPVLPLSLGE